MEPSMINPSRRGESETGFCAHRYVDEIADGRLGQPRDEREHGQRKAKLDIADAELFLQKWKQHRQPGNVERMIQRARDRQACAALNPPWLVAVRQERQPLLLKTQFRSTAGQVANMALNIGRGAVICP